MSRLARGGRVEGEGSEGKQRSEGWLQAQAAAAAAGGGGGARAGAVEVRAAVWPCVGRLLTATRGNARARALEAEKDWTKTNEDEDDDEAGRKVLARRRWAAGRGGKAGVERERAFTLRSDGSRSESKAQVPQRVRRQRGKALAGSRSRRLQAARLTGPHPKTREGEGWRPRCLSRAR